MREILSLMEVAAVPAGWDGRAGRAPAPHQCLQMIPLNFPRGKDVPELSQAAGLGNAWENVLQWDHTVPAQGFRNLCLSLSPGPGSGASMAEQDPAPGCPRGKQQQPGQCAVGVLWGFSLLSDASRGSGMWDTVVKWAGRRFGVRRACQLGQVLGAGLGCSLLGRVCTGMAKMELGEERP